MKKAGTAVLVILLMVLLAAVGCGIWYAVETSGFTRFEYLEYNGQKITSELRQLRIPRGKSEFAVRSMNPFADEIKYEVKIEPNSAESFVFGVDGNQMTFAKVGELTEYFGVELGKGAFTLDIPKEYSMKWLLSQVYEGSDVTVEDDVTMPDKDYFLMTVTFANGKTTRIYFGVGVVKEIELDPPGIIF